MSESRTDVPLLDLEYEIEAPAERVFELLTTEAGLLKWIAADAQCEPVVDGTLRWTHENGAVMSGRFIELQPPTRVVFTYGWESGGPDVPPGSTRVSIELGQRAGTTTLRLRHEFIPAIWLDDHRQGWEWFLNALRQRAVAA